METIITIKINGVEYTIIPSDLKIETNYENGETTIKLFGYLESEE